MRAVEGFDPGPGVRLSTYAGYWIKQAIRRAVIDQGKPVRLPAYLISLLARWRRTLAERLGRTPTHEEVGQALRLSKRRMRIAVQALRVHDLVPCAEDAEGDWDGLLRLLDKRVRGAKELVAEADDLKRILRGSGSSRGATRR